MKIYQLYPSDETPGPFTVQTPSQLLESTADDPERIKDPITGDVYRRVVVRQPETSAAKSIRQSQRIAASSIGILDLWALILPTHVIDEQLGDYLEDINRRAAKGQGRFKIWLRVLAAIFWTGVNTIGYFKAQVGEKKAGSKGQ